MTGNLNLSIDSTLIAIDIAKKSHDVLIARPQGKNRYLKIPNTIDGYQQVIDISNAAAEDLVVAFEPTADYHRNIAYWLQAQGAQCFLVSSLACARAREMLFETWDKNDRKDARVILYLMQQGLIEPFHDPLVNNFMDVQ